MSKKKEKHVKIGGSDRVYDVVCTIIITFVLLTVLYPLIFVVSSSFSSGNAVTSGKVILWPVDFSLTGYSIVLNHKGVWRGYLNTLYYTFVGLLVGLVMTILAAYPISRRDFGGRRILSVFFLIPMFFSGGLIPQYLLMSNLGLINTRQGIILLTAMNLTNVIIMRTFFASSVPVELLEAAKMDGISDFGYLVRIILPLSKPVVSVISLYIIVARWNAYYNPMIYLRNENYFPLQIILRNIMNMAGVEESMIMDPEVMAQSFANADVMRYSLIVVAAAPMLILYPFVQKFFQKGIMIGSLKG